MARTQPLGGIRVVITRPAGTGAALARRVRNLGGKPILLPGSSLRATADPAKACKALQAALACEVVIFTSPAAVRFARGLAPLRSRATVVAPGSGTRRALQRAGLADARAPAREDSEGILALPVLGHVRGRRVGIVGAAGGRGLLTSALATRGAEVLHAHVYERLPARLDRRHAIALLRKPQRPPYVLLSSAEALGNILAALPDAARRALLGGIAVVSSARLERAASGAGFTRKLRTSSARADDMLAAIIANNP
ncbi:MAG TPA: uroporphyrinogen-III synthase [Rhodanobacteraceae bacterium]|nr:uroporphyrinogen-III synthase [Rhodanobacteraceae bacterium]